jgi:hypothetical protein
MTGASGRHGRGWWIAVLFMVGSSLFALGAVPGYAGAAGLRVTAVTFFIGSLFFTSAAFLQYRQAVDALAPGAHPTRRVLVWAPRDLDWLACAVQLAGTLWFNWSTGNAVRENLSAEVGDQRVWRPDVLGSIAFLVASALACLAVHRAGSSVAHRSTDWWIGVANMTGSVAFGLSAIGSFIVPADGDLWDAELSNLGTFVGALCFLIGAALLLPAARRAPT